MRDVNSLVATSALRQKLASQLEALCRPEGHKIFREQLSTRVKVCPELEAALTLAHQFKEAAPEPKVARGLAVPADCPSRATADLGPVLAGTVACPLTR